MSRPPGDLPGDLPEDAPLTAVAAAVAELCGLELAAALVAARRGEVVYVPHTIAAGHPLAQALGLDRARRLAEHFGGERLEVPMALADEAAARRRLVLALRARGLSTAQIAREARCTQRRVFQILAAAGAAPDPRQPALL